MKTLMIAVVAVAMTGCAALKKVGTQLDPTGIAAANEREEQRKIDEATRAEAQKVADAKRAEQQKLDDAARAKAKAEREALEAKAKTSQQLMLAELNLSMPVPGDVQSKKHHSDAYGSPALLLTGEASNFAVIVANADSDRYTLDERIRRHMSEFKYGIDVIRRDSKPDGTWEFEFSYPIYSTEGQRMGSEMGYFSRKLVGGKKLNCFISGIDDTQVNQVATACAKLASAR